MFRVSISIGSCPKSTSFPRREHLEILGDRASGGDKQFFPVKEAYLGWQAAED
jgi:hypothetical protein